MAAGAVLSARMSRPVARPPGPEARSVPAAAVDRPDAPGDASAWLRRIDRLRAEDRRDEAIAAGWAAYGAVPASRRREILRALTLALLADVPEAQAREALTRRVEADPSDLDARVALLRRSLAAPPPPADGPRVGRASAREDEALAELLELLERAPGNPVAREAAIDALLDAGRIDEARSLLDSWPDDGRSAPGRLRARARFDLDIDGRPERAVEGLGRLLEATPHDWHLRARLSRALERSGDGEAARRQARIVDQLRERLDPDRLGRRLAAGLDRLDDPAALADLGELCGSVGLADLAAAWRREAASAAIAGLPEGASAPGPPR